MSQSMQRSIWADLNHLVREEMSAFPRARRGAAGPFVDPAASPARRPLSFDEVRQWLDQQPDRAQILEKLQATAKIDADVGAAGTGEGQQ